MTYEELVVEMQARLGQKVRVGFERKGRIRRSREGDVKPGLDTRSELMPDDDGRLVFRVVGSEWLVLDPRLVADAQEQRDGQVLRVEMVDGSAFVIETLTQPSPVRPHGRVH
jgi:hypothetical protein